MSIITRLEVQKKNEERANLYIDDKFFAGISIELCIKNHLKKGMEIDVEKLNDIILEDEKGSAFNKSLKYIGSSLKTKKQVREYLKKKDYNLQTIDYVIDKLCEYKYLDDSTFARSFVLTYSSKYGKLKLVTMLKSKGVSENIIDEVLEEDSSIKDSIEVVARKYLRNKEKTPEVYVKLSRFLYSRGYEFEDINRIVRILREE